MTSILSDAERYEAIERILAAPEPLCQDLSRERRTLGTPRRGLFFGIGFRERPATPPRIADEQRRSA